MKITQYVICYNEELLAPFVIDYWKLYADEVIVYNNCSSDKTISIINSVKDLNIKIINTNVDDLDDAFYLNIKSNCWKNDKSDFVVVSDFDEVLYGGKDIRKKLENMKESGYTIYKSISRSLISKELPVYEKNKLLHELSGVRNYDDSEHYNKTTLFNPNKISDINYTIGCHQSYPEGDIRYYDKNDIYLLHLRDSRGIENQIKIYKRNNTRLCLNNIQKNWGFHYSFPEDKIISDFNYYWSKSKEVLDLK